MASQEDVKLVDEALRNLSEHFDSVQIFASRHDGNSVGTVYVSKGSGNWLARYGHCQAWLVKEQESLRIDLRKEDEE